MATPVYSTVSAMLLSLPAVASRTNITSADMCAFLLRADALIDAKLGRLYSLPLAQPSSLLRDWIAPDIATYLMLRRFFTQEKSNDSPWIDRYKEAMTMLDEIASGDMPLVDDDGGVIGGRDSLIEVWSNNIDFQPTMTEDTTFLQEVDPDKIREIRIERTGSGEDTWQ